MGYRMVSYLEWSNNLLNEFARYMGIDSVAKRGEIKINGVSIKIASSGVLTYKTKYDKKIYRTSNLAPDALYLYYLDFINYCESMQRVRDLHSRR